MKTYRIKQNIYGNWNGYVGNRKVEDFGLDEVRALAWLTQVDEMDILRAGLRPWHAGWEYKRVR